MSSSSYLRAALYFILLAVTLTVSGTPAPAQSLGSAGTVSGVVTDPNGAVVPNASVTIANPVTGYTRTANADADGSFRFGDVPPNNYHITVSAVGFDAAHQDLTVRQSVPINLKIPLTVGGTSETVTITSGNVSDVIENVPSAHVDVDKSLIDRLPVRDPGSGLSTAVTLAAPGVAADSNGGYHPLGDHFESNISLDNQPISDQQSK